MTDLKPGHVYVAEKEFGNEVILVEKGELAQVLQDAKLWWEYIAGRLYFCDQCPYFNANAQAIQEHNEREHDCKFETYYSRGQILRVRTIKCHSRVTIRRKSRVVESEDLA